MPPNYTSPLKVKECDRRIRIIFNGVYIIDTTKALFVWEHEYFPQYWVPITSLHPDAKVTRTKEEDDGSGQWSGVLKVGDRSTDRVVGIKGSKGQLGGYARFEFGAMDHWYEEDTEIYVHPKDPYKRVDILNSTRHVLVKIDGVTVAESRSAQFLFETGLPARYYLPQTSILDWKALIPSKTTTRCPYKGEANYYNVRMNGKEYKDIIWWYRHPTHESAGISGLLCFYNEKVDIWMDGVQQERPKSHFG